MRNHLVYFHPDKKNGYGATTIDRWPKRLIEQELDVEKGYIVEKDLTLEEATEREEFLQLRDGYTADTWRYSHSVANVYKYFTDPAIRKAGCLSKESRTKAGKKISKALKGKSYSAKSAHKRWKPLKAYKVIEYRRGSKKAPAAILKKEYIGLFNNAYQAADALNLNQGDISNVLRPNSVCLTTKGYTFEFA